MTPYLYQYSLLTADDQARLARHVISSGRLGAIGGVYVPQLESLAAIRLGRHHAIATASATAALELTLRALSVGPGQEVVIPALGWVSVGAAVAATGASVRVAAVGKGLTPSLDQILNVVSDATAAVIVAHLRGMLAADIERIAAELRQRGIPLIEDCAQAWGVPGAGSRGFAAVFSTQTYKLIASGEGGIVACDDPDLAHRIRTLSGDTRRRTSAPTWRGNARMPEISAALALPQLQHLDVVVGRLRNLQRSVIDLLQQIAETVILADPGRSNGAHVGIWFATKDLTDRLATGLNDHRIRHWRPTAGDLHICQTWPVPALDAGPDWDCYLDIQIPYAENTKAEAHYLDLLVRALRITDGASA